MVEPEQKLLGYALPIAESRRNRRRVLCDGVAAARRYDRTRCHAHRRDENTPMSSPRAARRRPTAPDRSDDRAPSGDADRAASCSRPPSDATASSCSTTGRTKAASLENVIRTHSSAIALDDSRRIPRQTAERIPVRLVEVRTGPVAIGTGIGHARHRRCAHSDATNRQ